MGSTYSPASRACPRRTEQSLQCSPSLWSLLDTAAFSVFTHRHRRPPFLQTHSLRLPTCSASGEVMVQTRLLTSAPCWVGGCHLLPAWPALRTFAWRNDGAEALVGELGSVAVELWSHLVCSSLSLSGSLLSSSRARFSCQCAPGSCPSHSTSLSQENQGSRRSRGPGWGL